MIHTPALNELIKETLPYKSLGESFLAVNNNSEFMSHFKTLTATVFGENRPVGFGSIIACNNHQACVMLGEVDPEYLEKTVWVERIEDDDEMSFKYKITKSVPFIDYSGERIFEQTFADREEKPVHLHLLDILIDKSVGLIGLDVNKNITVDIVNNNQLQSWRDTVGLVVSDKHKFERITVDRNELLSLETDENENISIECIDMNKTRDLLDYDSELSIYNREEFLESLFKTGGSNVKVAKVDDQIVGYVVNTRDSILQCYGNTEEVQRKLFSNVANTMDSKISMYVRRNSNSTIDTLCEKALEKIQVTRLNSRTVINFIKWNKIACLNMGLYLY